jgi:hypothetical protein|tara:strand:+ start:337 stop:1044 length:708 start_codon:yes stop_codon:yes gene_type:complete
MATTIATISLASSDLTSSALAFSSSNPLNTAGTATGLSLTSGLSRTNFTDDPIHQKLIYRGDDATANGANKIYMKNLSTTPAEYFTLYINSEEMGRLYAGDWAFFPWAANNGTKRVFTVTIAATWAIGDTWEFDGVKIYADSATVGSIANQIHAANFPNWVTTHTADAATVVFEDRVSGLGGTTVVVTADGTLNTAGNGTANISSAAVSVEGVGDVYVKPSVATTMDLEHMLFHQ